MNWSTENRAENLWVPQNTIAETETEMYQAYYASTSRFNNVIVRSSTNNGNILTKATMTEALMMHKEIETLVATVEGEDYTLLDLCTSAGGTCIDVTKGGVCNCLVSSVFKLWNYDEDELENDDDFLSTINSSPYYSKQALESLFARAVFDDSGELLSAEALSLAYFTDDLSEGTTESDPVNEGWEKDVFIKVLEESVPEKYTSLAIDYLAGRSFSDEFGGAIQGDLLLVQVSYVVVFLFLGANLGSIIPGPNSRWTMSLAALVTVGLSIGASFGVSAAMNLFFGPVHSLLPFILLGIGVDDAFVIVNAFNRERNVPRSKEDDDDLIKRAGKALARAGASITVTSLTDLVAFGISASSSLPALASFCAYAAIGIIFLWGFASTFFSATLVLDERRQRDNRRECLCCLTRNSEKDDDKEEETGFKEDFISTYFRNIHAPAILSTFGKAAVLLTFAALFSFGVYGAVNLSVEDTQRAFIPSDSYLTEFINAADEYFPTTGIDLYFIFEGGAGIYSKRENLANLKDRLSGLSENAPYIAEPSSESTYVNVMTGLSNYLSVSGSAAVGNVPLGDDGWPTTEEDFTTTLVNYISSRAGGKYAPDVSLSDDNSNIEAIRVKSSYIALTKSKGGDIIDDADKQVEAMDATREMVEEWGDDFATVTTFSEKFLAIEGFKIIKKELFLNVGLALAAVTVIVFFTVASPLTSIIISMNVAFCVIEILGFMYVIGIAIDSVSVINIVLAVGLSIDYSAHVGHCFMLKGGDNKNRRVLEALADIGAAVLSGATSTFLAVVVLLFSTSYVFVPLSKQFALTVGLGVIHGLVLLPVLLSLFGPKPFEAAEMPSGKSKVDEEADDIPDDLVLDKDGE